MMKLTICIVTHIDNKVRHYIETHIDQVDQSSQHDEGSQPNIAQQTHVHLNQNNQRR